MRNATARAADDRRSIPNFIWLFLLSAAVLFAAAVSVSGAEESGGEEAACSAILAEVHRRVNPEYRDLIREEDLEAPVITAAEREKAAKRSGRKSGSGISYCATAEEAGTVIRGHLKAHDTIFDVGVKASGGITEALWNAAFDEAFAHTGDPKEGDYILMQYGGYTSQYVSYEKSGSLYYGVLRIRFTWFATRAQEKYVDQRVKEIIADMEKNATGDFGKIRYLYDFVCSSAVYDTYNVSDPDYMLAHCAYAVLADHRAVCQGFASLMYRLFLEAGIDARYIRGYADGENHGWNIAKLGSAYYHLDATWDAGESKYSYFLIGENALTGRTRRDEYNTAAFRSRYPVSSTSYAVPDTGITYGSLKYRLHGAEAAVCGYTGSPTSVEIPSAITGNGRSCAVTEISESAFFGCSSLVRLSIPSSVRRIGYAAFAGCSALTAVTVPVSVQEIASHAFYGAGGELTICNQNCSIYDHDGTIGTKQTLAGYSGSTAEAYALKYGRTFRTTGSVHTHTRAAKEIIREATCGHTGIVHYHCGICGYIEEEEIQKTEHSYTQYVIASKQNCGFDGTYIRYCEVCGQEDRITHPATGLHHFGNWETLLAATVLAEGKEIRTCPDCGKQERRTTAKLTPTWKQSAASLTMRKGQKSSAYRISGLAAGDSVTKWSSTSKKVATVRGKASGSCTITAKGTGSCVIRAKLASGKIIDVPLKVRKKKIRTTKVTLNVKAKISVKAGKSRKIRVTLAPVTTEDGVAARSSKKSVVDVAVKQGTAGATLTLKAKKAGVAVLRITSGKKTRKVTVTVTS